MRIEIVNQSSNSIEFSSQYGTGIGEVEQEVVVGQVLDVEFHIPKALTWDIDLRLTEATEASMSHHQGMTTLVGRLEQVDEDAVWNVRIGDGLLILEVSFEGTPPLLGSLLEIKTDALLLFPYAL